ncbi:hypothetical protein [Rhabdothermincola sp.]|uniref:hypothetical protein n=1 Tax=Rhabdothermincola sp. TaxID=2820405 RepID=UPI002FDFEC58
MAQVSPFRVGAVLVAVGLSVGCGSSSTSGPNRSEIIQELQDAGLSKPLAECVYDEANDRLDFGKLEREGPDSFQGDEQQVFAEVAAKCLNATASGS